jgi:CheY-like chemotaxis protein
MNKNSKHRILVVDDHPHGAKIVMRLLVREGFTTILASSGEEAMNRLAEEAFDAVISDVQMPVMDGFELLQNIHIRYPAIPVILMTAFLEEGMRESALAWGAAGLLQKPFSREQLKAALASAFANAMPGWENHQTRYHAALATEEEAARK